MQSEVKDFYASIKQLGFTDTDFELKEARDLPSSGSTYAVTGSVTVKRKITGTEKTYPAGHGSSWSASFYEDLKQRAFGAQQAIL